MLNRPFITLATIAGASLFSLASSFADTGAIAGNVLDFKGKALAGAEVRIERVANKSVAATTRTDAKGRFAVGNLPPVAYNVHVFVAGKEATSTNNVKAGSPEPTMVRFDLRPTQAASKATSTGKKKTKFVWVPAETGSHLGGHYVEVDDTSDAGPSAQNVNRASTKSLERVQNSGFNQSMGSGSR
jgi:hypothetical protein